MFYGACCMGHVLMSLSEGTGKESAPKRSSSPGATGQPVLKGRFSSAEHHADHQAEAPARDLAPDHAAGAADRERGEGEVDAGAQAEEEAAAAVLQQAADLGRGQPGGVGGPLGGVDVQGVAEDVGAEPE